MALKTTFDFVLAVNFIAFIFLFTPGPNYGTGGVCILIPKSMANFEAIQPVVIFPGRALAISLVRGDYEMHIINIHNEAIPATGLVALRDFVNTVKNKAIARPNLVGMHLAGDLNFSAPDAKRFLYKPSDGGDAPPYRPYTPPQPLGPKSLLAFRKFPSPFLPIFRSPPKPVRTSTGSLPSSPRGPWLCSGSPPLPSWTRMLCGNGVFRIIPPW